AARAAPCSRATAPGSPCASHATASSCAPRTLSSFTTEAVAPRTHEALVCRLVNDAPEVRRVRVRALDDGGHPTFDSGSFPLAAGASYVSGGGPGARRCVFTVEGDVAGLHGHGLLLSPEAGP